MKIQLSKAISVKDYTEAVECRIDMDEIALKRERYSHPGKASVYCYPET